VGHALRERRRHAHHIGVLVRDAGRRLLGEAAGERRGGQGTRSLRRHRRAGDRARRGDLMRVIAGMTRGRPALMVLGVRFASTANVNLSAPGATMDSGNLAAGDRVLLKNQSTGTQNGIYVWQAADELLTRAPEFDDGTEVRP